VKIIDSRKLLLSLKEIRRVLWPYVGTTTEIIWKAIDKNKRILFEDSHGAMLEVSHGSWPFTTGVNTALGALHRSFGGKAVRAIGKIVVSVKAYQTRVGGGPLPTEDFGRFGNYVREKGGEVGNRSGRARRCGPFDAPAILYGLNVIGATPEDEIALTKLDVLSGLNKIPVCVGYKFRGKVYKTPPTMEAEFLTQVEPKYIYLKGWSQDISKTRKFEDLPRQARAYVLYIQKLLERKITFIGVGKHKDDMILPP
jgi:adenylosuccinate synthase